MPDLDLERLQRDINLVAYAKASGYRELADDSHRRIAVVLEHAETHDRIAVARAPGGPWLYARLEGYEPRAADETPERAAARLRAAITEAPDKGTIIEFVQGSARARGLDSVSVDRVREHLLAWDSAQRALSPQVPERARDVDPSRDAPARPALKPELNRRRGDWAPAPDPRGPAADRLRRWEAQMAALGREMREPHARKELAFETGVGGRGRDSENVRPRASPEQSLRQHHARTDWRSEISRDHAELLGVAPARNRGPERGR